MQSFNTTDEIGPGERNQRILIIDDNAAIHEDIRKILGNPAEEDSALDAEAAALFGKATAQSAVEFEIDSAFQGAEGLEMVQRAIEQKRPYAMAFIDVRMPPGWDGIETISRIWKMYPELQVVICTAYSDYSWEEMIRKIGKTDSLVILKKPFDNVEVLQLAHTLTHKWTLSHRLQFHLTGLDEIVTRRTHELQSANARLRQEISERERAEKELSFSEERFAKAFQASPIPMAIQSLSTARFLDVNEAFLKISGLHRLGIISRTPIELNFYLDPEIDSRLLAMLRGGHSVRDFECELSAIATGVRECVVSAEPFQLGTEAVALIATQDVTAQRNLEKQLRHSQKLEAVGQFAAGMAHDFNNILTVIQGHAGMHLATVNLDKSIAESLEEVSAAAERAAALTRQLLTFSRKQIVQPRTLNLNSVVRSLQKMLTRIIGEHIDLQCTFDEDLPAIFADQSNIEQIVMNLVVNARDAMLQGGQLAIATKGVAVDAAHVDRNPHAHLGTRVCLSVSDTGCGMGPTTLGHIFEPFFTTKEVGKGTGLGLATVYGIVAQHSGWIEVVSAEGVGSTFHLFLPPSEAEAEPIALVKAPESRGGDETILVVEDEPALREIMTLVLRDCGYDVLEASDGPEAICVWKANSGAVDLLVTDIVMPNGLKGNMLAERLRGEKADLKILFSSGYSAEFGSESAPLKERINFLEKPYRPDVLVKAVRDCLDE